uniref:Metalloendopeptidase n=1 Tax=Oncorhynchus kisutch TaxID=8019 RepID=A0A8C7HZL8_ONCKI
MVWFLILIWFVQVGSVPITNFTNATTSNATFPATVDNSTNPNNSTNVTFTATGSTASMGTRQRQNDWLKTPETREEDLQFDLAIMEGDILVSEDRLAVKLLWPEKDGVASIPYKINDYLAAFKMISDQTCILFHEYTNEINYIDIISGTGCASYVGFQGGAQSLYFGRACNVGNLCHELMHALGLHHEHTRPDRDQYVTIQWDNVVPGYSHQHNILNHLTGITCGSGAGLVNLSPEELQCVGFSTSPTLTYLIQLFVVWSEDCTELTIDI